MANKEKYKSYTIVIETLGFQFRGRSKVLIKCLSFIVFHSSFTWDIQVNLGYKLFGKLKTLIRNCREV